ncbi:hypothetical protein [Methanolobus chelungpuianus]|nr:hypothetical protein [Methanolobus chelungpuianus]
MFVLNLFARPPFSGALEMDDADSRITAGRTTDASVKRMGILPQTFRY